MGLLPFSLARELGAFADDVENELTNVAESGGEDRPEYAALDLLGRVADVLRNLDEPTSVPVEELRLLLLSALVSYAVEVGEPTARAVEAGTLSRFALRDRPYYETTSGRIVLTV